MLLKCMQMDTKEVLRNHFKMKKEEVLIVKNLEEQKYL